MPIRRTLPVDKIVTRINNMIANAQPIERPVLCSLLESLLMDANAYSGFRYTNGYNPDTKEFDPYERIYSFKTPTN